MARPRANRGSKLRPLLGRIVWRKAALAVVAVAAVFGGGFGMGVWIADDPVSSDQVVEAAPAQTRAGSPAPVPAAAKRPVPATGAPVLTRDLAPRPEPKNRPVNPSGLSPEALGAPHLPTVAAHAVAVTPPPTELVDPGAVPWIRNAMAPVAANGRPMIAIVLDDLGVDRRRSGRAIDLPAPLTLAFLPYAGDVATQAARAHGRGHELLVHVPMQPHGADADPGPNALDMLLGEAEVRRRIAWNLKQFDGYVGMNNHMGSRFTESAPGASLVAEAVRARGLLLLDSVTSSRSVLGAGGQAAGVPTVERDVFLDNTDSTEEVRKRLAQTEEVARNTGTAIAIGHPRDATLEVLAPWLADVQTRGFVLVPLTQVLRARMGEGAGKIETVEVRE
ncbi:MAG: divergent polysaccharide deacetylase family protein [Alphaproteobacteria bacterium]|nr:divergent polysaccharide deacetylase family protein [Alphaproteobacteria bacterium]